MRESIEKKLSELLFYRRENDMYRTAYELEMHLYDDIRKGSTEHIDQGAEFCAGNDNATLSLDDVRNARYHFIAATTIATRIAIESGLDGETAYGISDVYILESDEMTTVEEIRLLYIEMMTEFSLRVHDILREKSCSEPVLLAKEYIHAHIHAFISVQEIADYVHLSQSYFSTLFKSETGRAVSDYIREKRVEAAKNMLKYSDYSFLDISNYLAFSSHSHFVSVFKKTTGLTPKQYRKKYYRSNWT